jgi:uncharacterized protein
MVSEVINDPLLAELRANYHLDWDGVHGYKHWMRVRETGLRLAELTQASPRVVELFAFTHDIQRLNDHVDPLHGQRASHLIRERLVDLIKISAEELDWLCEACANHTLGLIDANPTIQTCWDADRLDLMRVGIRPNPLYLCTEAARQPEMIEWAVRRSFRE